jgi:nucleotide-binding universal stress UspA family protein
MKIVVATDGSRGGTAAVRFAARLAGCDPGAQLILLTVGGAGAGIPGLGLTPKGPDEVLSRAAREVRDLGVARKCTLMTLRTRQEIPEAISALADRLRADLVVVGSEGRDTLAEWVVGGVALRLIYVAKRPVVVVRPRRRPVP